MAEFQKIDEWDFRIQNMEAFQHLIMPGSGRSYPMFFMHDGVRCLRYFFMPFDQVGPNRAYIAPPTICITVQYSDFSLLEEIEDCFELPPFEPYQFTVDAAERAQRKAQIGHLRTLYNTIEELFPNHAATDDVRQFWSYLKDISPVSLMPYYRAISPEFYDWLHS